MKFRFSLRQLMAICAVVAVSVAVIGSYVRNSQFIYGLAAKVEGAEGSVILERSGYLPSFASIVGIDFSGPDQAIDKPLLREIAGVESLRELRVDHRQLDDADWQIIASIHGLETLSLRGTNVTDSDLESLKSLKELVHLDVSLCHVSDACLGTIQALPSLEEVSFAGTEVSIDAIGKLRMKSLRVIDASDCFGERLDLSREGFGGMDSLRGLSIRGCDFDEVVIDSTIPNTTLKSFNMLGTDNAALVGLSGAFPQLEELGVASNLVDNSSLVEINKFARLSKLLVSSEGELFRVSMDDLDASSVKYRGITIDVPVNEADKALGTLQAIFDSHPELTIQKGGRLSCDIYERRKAYGVRKLE